MKQRLHSVLRAAGFDVIRWPASTLLAVDTSAGLRRRRITVVLDVGGRFGDYAAFLRRIGYQGRIVSIEPASENYAVLAAAAAADPDWQTVQLALGSSRERRPLLVMASSDMNSFSAASDVGRGFYGAEVDVTGEEIVQVETVDSLFGDYVKEEDCVLLKLDTQGWELEILEGATASLNRIELILIELLAQPIYDVSPSHLEILGWLERRGYVPVGFYPVHNAPDDVLIAYDCLLQRMSDPGRTSALAG